MAALALTAYGVHWWAIGGARALGGDPRPNAFIAVAFTMISVLGLVVFAVPASRDVPVALLFVGLTLIYVSDFFASASSRSAPRRRRRPPPVPWEHDHQWPPSWGRSVSVQ